MKILFLMRHSGYVRNFESTLRLLCARGHTVHLSFQTRVRHWLADAADTPQQLAAEYPHFSYGMAPPRDDGWGLLGRQLRLNLDYLRYFGPAYAAAPKLRRRAEQDADEAISTMGIARPGRAMVDRPCTCASSTAAFLEARRSIGSSTSSGPIS